MSVEKNRIIIYPQEEIDEAYIENTLGLKKEGDYVKLQRTNAIGLSKIAYLKTTR